MKNQVQLHFQPIKIKMRISVDMCEHIEGFHMMPW